MRDDTLEPPPAFVNAVRGPPLTWQQAVTGYLPYRYQAWGLRHANDLPLALVTLLFSLMALRLNNTAFIDEALYINAGYDYLAYWFADGPYIDHVRYFSGSPVLYPVFVAVLDMVGGLWLARALSWALMVITMVVTARTTMHCFGYRAGMLAAVAFAFVGPVVFVGHLATYDALCVTLLTLAGAVATTQRSLRSALGVGVLLTLAVAVKYAGGAFVPAVLALMLFVGQRPLARTLVATLTVGAAGIAGYLLASDSLRAGIGFTTTARTALGQASSAQLASILVISVGILIVLALLGGCLAARSWAGTLGALTLLGASALLPTGQFILGEVVAFEKHLAYSAVFLAPLAGRALDRLSRGTFAFAPVLLIVVLMVGVADVRSRGLFEWGDVTPVLEVIEQDPLVGTYLSSHADSLKYHTRHRDGITWQTTFSLYPQGEASIREMVAAGRFDVIILHGGETTGNPDQDAGELVLVSALADVPQYELVRTRGGWRIFTWTGDHSAGGGTAAEPRA